MDDLRVDIEFLINNPVVKADSEKVKADILGVGATAEKTAERVAASINRMVATQTRPIDFGNSAAEIKKYSDELERLAKGRVASSGTDEFITILNNNLAAGKISLEEFNAEIDRLAKVDFKMPGGEALKDQTGLLEQLKLKLTEVRETAEKAGSISGIEKANAKIQEYQTEINRLSNIGKQGFNDLGNRIKDSVEKPVGAFNRLKYAAELYKKASAEATNPELIAKYNRKLQETQEELKRTENVGKAGFDELGNAIKEKASTLTEKFLPGLVKIVNFLPGIGLASLLAFAIDPIIAWLSELSSADKALKRFNETRQETAGLIAKEVGETTILIDKIKDKNVAEGQRNLLLNEFINKNPAMLGALTLQNIATAEGTDILNKYTDALSKRIEQEQLEKSFIESKQRAADLRSGKLGDETDKGAVSNAFFTAGQILLFKTKKQADAAIKENDERLRAAAGAAEDIVAEGYLNQIKAASGGAKELNKVQDTSLAELEKRLTSVSGRLSNLQKGKDSSGLKAEKKQLEKEIADRKKELGLDTNLTKNTAAQTKATNESRRDGEQAIKQQQSLQERIQAIKDKFNAKAQDKDEEARLVIVNEFKNLAADIQKQAEMYDKYVKKYGQAKADKSGLKRPDAKEIEPIRDAAKADLKQRQETEHLKITLSEAKDLYADFEDFKTSLGEAKAKEHYASLINTDKTYLGKLRDEYAKLKDIAAPTGAETERKTFLEKQIREAVDADARKLAQLLQATQTYDDAVLVENEKFEREKARLTAESATANVEVLTKTHQDTLAALADNHIQQLSSYQALFGNIETLTVSEAQKHLKEFKELIDGMVLPPELLKKNIALIKQAELSLKNRVFNDVGKMADAFIDVANSVQGLNDSLADSIGFIGNMLKTVQQVGTSFNEAKQGIQDYKQNKADGGGGLLGSIGAVASIAGPIGKGIGAAINLVKGVVSFFKAAKESRKKAQEEIAAFDAQKGTAEFEINQLYRDRLRTQLEINASTVSGLKDNTVALKKQQQENAADAKMILQKLQSEQFVSGKKTENYGGFLGVGRKTRTVDVMASLYGKTYEDIEKLFLSGQLTDKAKALFQELEKIKAEGGDINKLLEDNKSALMERVTGTTAESITDSIIEGFENGYRTAADFANDFKNLMNKATREIFKEFIEQQELKAFYEQYANLAKEGALTPDQKSQLKLLYDAMIGRINNKYEDLKGITGEDFLASPADKTKEPLSKNSLTGSIKSEITEETGTVVAGRLYGIQLGVLEGNTIAKANGQTAMQQMAILKEHLLVSIKTEENTKLTAQVIQSVDSSLKSIDKKIVNSGSILASNGKVI